VWGGLALAGGANFGKNAEAVNQDLVIPLAKRGAYVDMRYNFILKHKNLTAGSQKILIIGDSFSGDLVNMIYEGGVAPNAAIVLERTAAICQLYFGNEDIYEFIEEKNRAQCKEKWLSGETRSRINKLAQEADIVVFAIAWQKWSIERIGETLANLDIPKSAKIIVLGSKGFGKINIKSYLNMTTEERTKARNKVDQNVIVSSKIAREIAAGNFIFVDIHAIVCGENSADCPVFTPEGKLISYDGSHLTQAGAKFIGEKLKEQGFLRN
jgi:hypothetical protein